MDNIIWKVRKETDRCFEETMRREVNDNKKNDMRTYLPNLIRTTFSDYCTENQKHNSKLILRMYQYCISEFKYKITFSEIKRIAGEVMKYNNECFHTFQF